jgi:peptidoglycan/xylan/chitin deacetylase (PgdA/CDA1 family)/GT2 family glycosyltransferase
MTEESAQSANTPLCSVIVTTWRRPVLLQETLRSLLRQSYQSVEIIVVCDGEDADVRSIARCFETQSIRWIYHSVNCGLPAARNTGAREATGDIVLFLDDDVVADRELVSVHVQHHLSAGSLRHVAATALFAEERETPVGSIINVRLHEAMKALLRDRSTALGAKGLESIGERFDEIVCFGLNCSIRRKLFLESGGFDEHFRDSDEEMEMGLRLHHSGIEFIFEPRILLTHRNSKDLSVYFRRCWSASGALDSYRVFELRQENAQTSHLASIFTGCFLKRMTSRLLWKISGPSRSLIDSLEQAANRTRSPFLFSVWARVARPIEYLNGAKSSSCTLDQLKQVIQPAKCALMLHSIHEPESESEASYYVSPGRFHRLMRWFDASGRKTARLSEYAKGALDPNHVLLTFDDGYDDLYQKLLPLALEKGYTAVIYLVADRIGSSNMWDQQKGLRARKLLTAEQIREMQKYGFEFGSHTLSHPFLPDLSDAELQREVVDSKHRLEDILGTEVSSFAYPYGGVDRRVRAAVARGGYKLAFTAMPGLNFWNDPLCQRRAEVNEHTTSLDFLCLMRHGQPVVPWISTRFSALETSLPTSGLRRAAGIMHRVSRATYHAFNRTGEKSRTADRD